MHSVDNLSDDAFQSSKIVLDDTSVVELTLRYLPVLEKWSFDIVHPNLIVYGKILANAPNLLRQWRNTSGFGLMCVVTDGSEPAFIDDFLSGRVQLHVLENSDVDYVEEQIYRLGL